MASHWGAVTVDCADPDRLAAFWAAALGYVHDPVGAGWARLLHPQRTLPDLVFQRVPEGKSGKNRVHLDLAAVGVTRLEEQRRLEGLGATHVRLVDDGDPEDVHEIMLDPEGNEFCLLGPS